MRKGYKAYDKGLICRGKQYEVGQTYEEPEAVICEKGMHYCDNPADVMYYHDLIDADGDIMEVTEVEDLDPDGGEKKDDGYATKYCTKKLKVGAKLSFGEWVKAVVEFALEKSERKASGDSARMASSGYSARMASSGYSARMASSGDSARMASSGYSARMASSGDSAQMASSGDSAQMASSGYSARMASSGDSAQMASSGDSARMASSGYSARMASSGDSAQMASSGDSAQMASSGYYAQMASSGDDSVIAAIGIDSKAKGALGNWLTLAEWTYSEEKGRYIPVCVKTEHVDGERIKADTWYKLEGGEFMEE